MKLRRGTSIIEIVIAAALISIAIIAALSLANHSQKQNTYARGLAEATKYTTQASDWIRTQKNTLGWATINTLGAGSYCLNEFPTDFTAISPGDCGSLYIPTTMFQRKIFISKDNPSLIKIIIEVSWQENGPRQATIEMELAQW